MTLDQVMQTVLTDSIAPALVNALSTQAGVQVDIKPTGAVDTQGIDLLATLSLKSSKFAGTIALLFPKATFVPLVNQMLGETSTDINDGNADAVGEILNIAYASGRVLINKVGHDFQPSIPTVVRGQSVRLIHGESAKRATLVCACTHGKFYIEISLKQV